MKISKYFLLTFNLLAVFSYIQIPLNFKEENNFYTVPIYLGSTGQEFEVQIDTTTSETWVPSVNTSTDIPKYNFRLSKKSTVTNKTFEIDDESGNVKGKATFDRMKVGNFMLEKMGFVQIDQYAMDFHDYQQGKLGLGFYQEHGDEFNWIKMLKENGLIKHEIFTIDNEKKQLVVGDLPGDYSIKEYTTCDLVEVSDLDDKFRAGWVCEMTHILCGIDTETKSLETAIQVDSRAIFDSGYEYINLPYRHLKNFKEMYMKKLFDDSCIDVKRNNDVYFICDDDEHITESSIGFVIGGYAYVLPADRLFRRVEEDKFEMLIRFHKENDDICTFGIPFMNYFSLSFDSEEEEIGFYGGQKIDFTEEWDEYINDNTPYQKKERMKNAIIISLCLGGVLLLIVICIIFRQYKKSKIQGPNNALVLNEEV